MSRGCPRTQYALAHAHVFHARKLTNSHLRPDAVMRQRTNSNTLHISKMLDTPANKKVWAKYGPRSLALAKKAKAGLPKDHNA